MGDIIRHTGNEMKERWIQKMPRFFYWLVVIACGIGGAAFAINQGLPMMGGTHSEWWDEAYRYIISACIGVVFACKFTVAGGYKEVDPDKLSRGNTVINQNIDHMDADRPTES